MPHRREALERIVLHATNLRIPIVEVEGGTLTSLAGFDGHQGVAVVVEPRRWAGLEDILARAIELGEPPFVLALDSLEDPHNVGTLLRSAEAAGVHGVLFPTHRQAPLSPSAVKASAGAVEHLLLCPVDDLAAALADLHIRGLRIAGAEADAPLTAREADLRGPLAIVVGSEGQGLGPAVRRRVDITMRIPMRGTIDSLNAAVAGSILVFEALAQRDPSGTSRVRPPRQPLAEVAPAAPSDEPGAADTSEEAGAADAPDTADASGAESDAEAAPDGSAAEHGADMSEAGSPQADASPADETHAPAAPVSRRGRPRKTAAAPPAETLEVVASEPEVRATDERPAPATRRGRPRKAAAEPPLAEEAEVSPPADATADAERVNGEPAPKPRRRTARAAAAAEPASPSEPIPAPPKRRASRAKATPAPGATPAETDADDDLLPGGPPSELGE